MKKNLEANYTHLYFFSPSDDTNPLQNLAGIGFINKSVSQKYNFFCLIVLYPYWRIEGGSENNPKMVPDMAFEMSVYVPKANIIYIMDFSETIITLYPNYL